MGIAPSALSSLDTVKLASCTAAGAVLAAYSMSSTSSYSCDCTDASTVAASSSYTTCPTACTVTSEGDDFTAVSAACDPCTTEVCQEAVHKVYVTTYAQCPDTESPVGTTVGYGDYDCACGTYDANDFVYTPCPTSPNGVTTCIQTNGQYYADDPDSVYEPSSGNNFSGTSSRCVLTCNFGYTLSVGGTACVLGASGAAADRARARRRAQLALDDTFARRHCRRDGTTACPLNGGGYECVDTNSSLESCGGCSLATGGVDCSALPFVSDVECSEGVCVIGACMPGTVLMDGKCLVALD
ncbi:hypothetical protein MNV49_000475 [Pseudohyphozyma bogoriensis]|nr:hypothetical protein MNV49_000475 [Pseudohyphozyma bogoriensis]